MNRLVLTCLCALALTAPAQAQSPQVDPDTPAGAEYQLPVDRARQQARERAGTAGAPCGRASSEAPLFGSGVQSSKPEQRNPRPAGAPGASDRDPPRGADREPGLGTGTPEVRAQVPAPDDGGSGLVAIGGGALGVLLFGGLAGLAWRRRTVRR